jgi:hypothetical protein
MGLGLRFSFFLAATPFFARCATGSLAYGSLGLDLAICAFLTSSTVFPELS